MSHPPSDGLAEDQTWRGKHSTGHNLPRMTKAENISLEEFSIDEVKKGRRGKHGLIKMSFQRTRAQRKTGKHRAEEQNMPKGVWGATERVSKNDVKKNTSSGT